WWKGEVAVIIGSKPWGAPDTSVSGAYAFLEPRDDAGLFFRPPFASKAGMAKRRSSTIPAFKRKRKRGWPARIAMGLIRLVLAFVLISVLWVLAYRFVPPPITATMVGDLFRG